MTSIFDRWTDLDPALALRRIEAAHGSVVFDKYAYLDPQRALIQIETAFGIELDDVNGLLDPSTLEAVIDTAIEAESDSTPDWVPADAVIHIDLVNDRAWTEADGEVAIDTLLGSDSDASNGWGSTDYNPAGLSVDGYAPDNTMAFIGAAKTTMLAGSTVLTDYERNAVGQDNIFSLVSLDGNTGISAYAADDVFKIVRYVDNAILATSAASINEGSANKVAVTFTTAHSALSANGAAAVTSVLDGASYAAAVNDLHNTGPSTIRTITIYDPLDDADLPTLTRIIPEDAKVHIDLMQDWAWTEVDGYVAINTLLGTDANTVNGWGATSYDAADLTVDGLVYADSPPALIGAARTKVLDEATTVVRWKQSTTTASNLLNLLSADGNDGIDFAGGVSPNRIEAESFNGSLSVAISDILNYPGINVLASTITADRLDYAVNGDTAVTSELTSEDRPLGNPYVAALIDIPDNALQSITVYDALPSTAGLSALSETA